MPREKQYIKFMEEVQSLGITNSEAVKKYILEQIEEGKMTQYTGAFYYAHWEAER